MEGDTQSRYGDSRLHYRLLQDTYACISGRFVNLLFLRSKILLTVPALISPFRVPFPASRVCTLNVIGSYSSFSIIWIIFSICHAVYLDGCSLSFFRKASKVALFFFPISNVRSGYCLIIQSVSISMCFRMLSQDSWRPRVILPGTSEYCSM